MRPKRVSDNEIIEMIKENDGQSTAYQIELKTGYTRQNVADRLNSLFAKGKLKKLQIGRKLVLWSI